DSYRRYLAESRGEFTVAKDQNVRLRSGWFSDRSAAYLAAGRPVVTQETGFSNVLPTGAGLFGFADVDEAAARVEEIDPAYQRIVRAASAIAAEYFAHDVVLPAMLANVGVELACPPAPAAPPGRVAPIPEQLVLEPESRRPLRLAEATASASRLR